MTGAGRAMGWRPGRAGPGRASGRAGNRGTRPGRGVGAGSGASARGAPTGPAAHEIPHAKGAGGSPVLVHAPAQGPHHHADPAPGGDLVAGPGRHVPAGPPHQGSRPVPPRPARPLEGVEGAQPRTRARGRVQPHAHPGRARSQRASQHPGAPGPPLGHDLGHHGVGGKADGAARLAQLAGEQGVLPAAEPVPGVETQAHPAYRAQVQQQVAGVRAGHDAAVGRLPGVEGAAVPHPRAGRAGEARWRRAGHRLAAQALVGVQQGLQPAGPGLLVVVDKDQQVIPGLLQGAVASGHDPGDGLVDVAQHDALLPGPFLRGPHHRGRPTRGVVVHHQDPRGDR